MANDKSDPVVITGTARTPMGSFQGCFSSIKAPELGAASISAAIERSGVEPDAVDDVIMGCVLPAGIGQAPARQAAIGGGLPVTVPCTTVNKMCGSGMKAVMMGYDALHANPENTIVAGGLESMSNAPYLLLKNRSGARLGHDMVFDHMFLDGLEDSFGSGKLMGDFAENTAEKYQFSREAQDKFALTSLQRAKDANEDGTFAAEITPVVVKSRRQETTITKDQQPYAADLDKIPHLPPAFRKDGSVTAANSSSISDGGAAMVLMRASQAEKKGATPRARIVACASHAQAPKWFTTAPIGAMKKVLDLAGWDVKDVGLYEINEAFAVVTMAAMQDLGLSHDQVNIHGGACALGHPVGASGARIIVTLLSAMEKHDVERGVASLCIGGGEATAVAIELMS